MPVDLAYEEKKFHDPLYELSIFRIKGHDSLLQMLSKQEQMRRTLYFEVLATYEVTRQAYLRQAGLCWLVFPSASHTRFTHSIGTWTLGTFALEHIWVDTGTKKQWSNRQQMRKLGEWLEVLHSGFQEEFLLTLLLHDIGHFPFSHVVEKNPDLGGKVPDHESATVQLITGKGPVYELAKARADALGLRTVSDVLKQYDFVRVDLMASLLSGESTKEYALPPPADLRALKELVNGSADLDRLDHYNRDAYFMGLRIANTSVRSLLENLVIHVSEGKISVLEDGESDLMQLLFGRDLLWRKALDNDVVTSFEAMLNAAVSRALKSGFSADDLYLMTDDELLYRLQSYDSALPFVRGILAQSPFQLALKLNSDLDRESVSEAFAEWCKGHGFSGDEFLLYLSPLYGSNPEVWLNLEVMRRDGRYESLDRRQAEFIHHLADQERARRHHVRLYAQHANDIAAQASALDDFARNVGDRM